MKIKCPTLVNGLMYGIKWADGFAETDDKELVDRLVLKGYEVVADTTEAVTDTAEAEVVEENPKKQEKKK